MIDLTERVWWDYVHQDIKDLLNESNLLAAKVENWDEKFHDYAFVVFPAAKAYEGFLKTLFLDMGFIDEDEYRGKRFRIGKALNPSLDRKRYRGESVYDRIVEYCGGEELAKSLWDTWKNGRNLLFHWFPEEKNAISFDEAKTMVMEIIDTMDLAFGECKIESKS